MKFNLIKTMTTNFQKMNSIVQRKKLLRNESYNYITRSLAVPHSELLSLSNYLILSLILYSYLSVIIYIYIHIYISISIYFIYLFYLLVCLAAELLLLWIFLANLNIKLLSILLVWFGIGIFLCPLFWTQNFCNNFN